MPLRHRHPALSPSSPSYLLRNSYYATASRAIIHFRRAFEIQPVPVQSIDPPFLDGTASAEQLIKISPRVVLIFDLPGKVRPAAGTLRGSDRFQLQIHFDSNWCSDSHGIRRRESPLEALLLVLLEKSSKDPLAPFSVFRWIPVREWLHLKLRKIPVSTIHTHTRHMAN